MALAQAGGQAHGATAYVTLEPCAHQSARGPACSDLLIAAGVARVVAAIEDPDPRTAGRGFARLRDAGISVETSIRSAEARRSMAGFLSRLARGRPHVTLKLATSLDGCIAMADGSSRWITGPLARAHVHLERSRHEAILVGRGTVEADVPQLDVRLPGLESRTPIRVMLSRTAVTPPDADKGTVADWRVVADPHEIASLPGDHVFVEGGAAVASAFLAADLVDRLLLYRAPILIGNGRHSLGDIGLGDLSTAHRRWSMIDARQLGSDRVEVYERERNEG